MNRPPSAKISIIAGMGLADEPAEPGRGSMKKGGSRHGGDLPSRGSLLVAERLTLKD
jgi:hypothetical protein